MLRQTAISLRREDDQPTILQLAGRGWKVTSVDWARRVASVEPSTQPGRSRWIGSPRSLGFDLCQAVRSVLAGCDPEVTRSRRTETRLAELREEMPFCTEDDSSLVTDASGMIQWWTFAGLGATAVLAQRLKSAGEQVTRFDNFSVQLEREPFAPLNPVMHSAQRRASRTRLGTTGWTNSSSSSTCACQCPPHKPRSSRA
jgi:ATP-dependent Lhr-like helicase